MRNYGKVYARFWTSEDVRRLTDDGRLLALYLLTCEHGTLAGICRLPDGYVCEDMQWPAERVAKGFGELFRKGFATRCERTKWVWITKFLEWNRPENRNQLTAARHILKQVPNECEWRAEFQQVFDELSDSMGKGFPNPSGTVSNPVTVTVSGSGTVSVTQPVTETGLRSATVAPAASGAGSVASDESAQGGEGEPPTKPNGNGLHGPPPEPVSFAALKAAYPDRSGSQRWAEALEHYTANLKAGFTEQQMLEGVQRYAQWCTAEGLVGQSCVRSANAFLGKSRGFLEAWTPSSVPKPARRVERAGERWLREQRAKDANA